MCDNENVMMEYENLLEMFSNKKRNMILADLIESNNYNSNLYLNTYCGSYASDDNKLHIILKHDENFQNYADNLDEAKIKYE